VLSNILESVSRALGRWAYMGRSALPRLLEAVRRRRSARTGQSRLSLPIRRSPRDRVRYYYLSTIERATGLGIPRGRTQTPYEYQAVLAGRLPDAEPMMSELTEAFVEARYSSHTISRRDEEKARVVFAELRRLLRRSREQSTEDSK